MPATGLKIFGTGAEKSSISSSFQNSLKTSGHRCYEFLEFWCRKLLSFLPDYRFPASGEFVVIFDVFLFNDAPNILYRRNVLDSRQANSAHRLFYYKAILL